MHFKTIRLTVIGLLLSGSLFTTSCKKDPLPIKTKEYNFELMGKKVEEKFNFKCLGMQYSITQNGQLKVQGAIGYKVIPVDGDSLVYTTVARKSVHSCSKTISAAAMMYQLNKFGINIDSTIAKYLPVRWNLIPAANNVTFRQLLQHRSGMKGTRDSFGEMRSYFEEGGIWIQGDYEYANVNYSLMRLLIPMLDPALRKDVNDNYSDNYADVALSNAYVDIVRQALMIPAGISKEIAPAIWDGPQDPKATRNYNFDKLYISGYTHTPQTFLTGAGGWYMNTNEYAAFLAYLFGKQYSGVDPEFMMANVLGMFEDETASGTKFYTHNGSFTDGQGRGGICQWIFIPSSKMAMVVQINSQENLFKTSDLPDMMIEAINEAYQ
jgi:CubicO group peptidase (beta-lactamase class C family)